MMRLVLPLMLFLACGQAETPPLAVQGAVDSELGPLLEAIGNPPARKIGSWSFWEGKLGQRDVVISRTEVGMVNAAVATTLLIREYAPEVIINQGTAGGTHPDLDVGDIIIGATSVDYGAVRTPPRKEGEGIDIDAWQAIPRRLRLGDERVSFERFESDPELVKIAQTIPYEGGRLIVGSVGSADQFNREIDKLAWARKLFAIDSEDMESAAVAQVSHAFGVRFVPIRIISDNEYHGGVFYREKGEDCARFALSFLERLAR